MRGEGGREGVGLGQRVEWRWVWNRCLRANFAITLPGICRIGEDQMTILLRHQRETRLSATLQYVHLPLPRPPYPRLPSTHSSIHPALFMSMYLYAVSPSLCFSYPPAMLVCGKVELQFHNVMCQTASFTAPAPSFTPPPRCALGRLAFRPLPRDRFPVVVWDEGRRIRWVDQMSCRPHSPPGPECPLKSSSCHSLPSPLPLTSRPCG